MDTQVLIVGAGPVGLTLAIDLGKRGIRCTLIEKNDAPLGYPKMERCNPRTMEIFRRLGLGNFDAFREERDEMRQRVKTLAPAIINEVQRGVPLLRRNSVLGENFRGMDDRTR